MKVEPEESEGALGERQAVSKAVWAKAKNKERAGRWHHLLNVIGAHPFWQKRENVGFALSRPHMAKLLDDDARAADNRVGSMAFLLREVFRGFLIVRKIIAHNRAQIGVRDAFPGDGEDRTVGGRILSNRHAIGGDFVDRIVFMGSRRIPYGGKRLAVRFYRVVLIT